MIDTGGDGPVLVCAHGMLMDHRMFAPQAQGLAPGHRVIAYDHGGRGPRGAEPFDLYDLATDFQAILDGCGVDRCVLIGMSLGGFMTLRAALVCPERLHGVVVIGAGARPYDQATRQEVRRHYAQVRELAVLPADFARHEAHEHFAERTRRERPELVAQWAGRFASRSGAQTWYETLAWAEQDDVRDRLASLQLPALLIHGDEDAAVGVDVAWETFGLLPAARLAVVPYAGHAVNLEQPALVNALIETFVSESVRRPTEGTSP
jgi:pimeloyl-ACP methyl ester carboxylesterase